MTAPASAFFRTWRDLEALLATRQWTVRASPAIGDGADVLYFVPPAGSDVTTVQVRHLGKAQQASVWALRGSAGSMMALDPDTAASVEARRPQWRVEAMMPDHPQFPTRDSFTLVCGDVLVALGFMEAPDPRNGPRPTLDERLAQFQPPHPESAVAQLQRRVDAAAAHDAAFTIHDAGYSPDHFGTTADMVEAARLMDLLDGDDDVSDDELQAAMAMPLDAPGRDEAMTRVFGDDRRNWPGDPHDIDGPATYGRAHEAGADATGQVWAGYAAQPPRRDDGSRMGFPTREQYAAALTAAGRRKPAWRRIGPAFAALGGALWRQLLGAR
jgi:hypothetical protein